MKKIINVTICIFTLFSGKAFSDDISESDFFSFFGSEFLLVEDDF